MKGYAWLGAAGLALASSTAFAQQVYVTAQPPPPPQVVVTAPPSPVVYGPGPGYYGPRYYGGPGPGWWGYYGIPRLRFALGITGGPYVGDNVGGGGGLWGQLGIQINRLIGVYYQTHAMIGYVSARNNFSGCADAAGCGFFGGIWLNELMIDFTIQDVFQIGVGPSVDLFSVDGYTEGFFGADARIGVAFGRNRWRRAGFMLGVDVHPTFVTDSTFPTSSVATAILLTLGGGFY